SCVTRPASRLPTPSSPCAPTATWPDRNCTLSNPRCSGSFMYEWLRGIRRGMVAFAVICLLVAGGLGWGPPPALLLEQEQRLQQARGEHAERLRLALWRLDSRIRTILAREDSRPFNHFSAIFAPPLALDSAGTPVPPGSVLEPSPLL